MKTIILTLTIAAGSLFCYGKKTTIKSGNIFPTATKFKQGTNIPPYTRNWFCKDLNSGFGHRVFLKGEGC